MNYDHCFVFRLSTVQLFKGEYWWSESEQASEEMWRSIEDAVRQTSSSDLVVVINSLSHLVLFRSTAFACHFIESLKQRCVKNGK